MTTLTNTTANTASLTNQDVSIYSKYGVGVYGVAIYGASFQILTPQGANTTSLTNESAN